MQPQAFPYLVPKCNENIVVLYEDDHVLLVNKPAFLLSMPGRHPANKDSLITRIQQQYPDAHLVHRLDLDTSGIMIVPIRRSALSHIAKQFQDRLVRKTYQAVLDGLVSDDYGSIDLPIAKDWANRPLQKICHENGKPSLTHFRVLMRDTRNKQTRVEFTPVTGRSHQLRLHSQAIGHPILGCDLYAHDAAFHASKRLMLHAVGIAFIHPRTGRTLEACSPCPF